MTPSLITGRRIAVRIDGRPISAALAMSLSQVLVRQVLCSPAVAEIDFANVPAVDAQDISHGAAVTITVTDTGGTLFAGETVSIEHEHDASHGQVLRVRAYDRLQRLRKRHRVRAIADASAATIAAELAGDLGVPCRASDSSPRRALVMQQGQSDLDLLADLAADAGLYPALQDGELRLLGLDGDGDEIPLGIGRELLSVKVSHSNERALGKVEALAWNPHTFDLHRGAAASARQDSFSLRDTGLSLMDGIVEKPILNRLSDGDAEAAAAAQAGMDRAAAFEAIAVGVAVGDPALVPGRPIRIEGIPEPAGGRYVVTTTLHRFDSANGYRTEFSTEPPSRAPRNRSPLLSIGKVSAIDDPEGFGRCRLKLPAFGGLETGWLQVMTPGAGKGKGIAALPEVADSVLVVFPDGDAARGVVLGSIYGKNRPPRGLGAKKDRPFVMRTGGGQTLELAAAKALARLATSAGSLLELTPDGVRLAAVGDLVIEAPGKAITIRAASIDFQQG